MVQNVEKHATRMVSLYYFPIVQLLVYGLNLAVPVVLHTTERTNLCRYKSGKKLNSEAVDGFMKIVCGSPLVFMKVLFVSGVLEAT